MVEYVVNSSDNVHAGPCFFISVPINKPEELEQERQNNDMIKM